MTQEEKELLLKDLCARLPYHVKVKVWLKDGTTEGGALDLEHNYGDVLQDAFYFGKIKDIKPYLRPMSSMTEEEKREIYDWLVENDIDWFDFSKLRLDEILISFDSSWLLVDWLNKHQFDFRGLIEKGLAIEALKGYV